MAVAPELFVREHAQGALEVLCFGVGAVYSHSQVIEKVLISHNEQALGMKTLDPADWNYCGDYGLDQFQHSTDPKTAGGFNYHQGPEWVWPIGYFLRAKTLFSGPDPNTQSNNAQQHPLASLTAVEVAHTLRKNLKAHRHTIKHSRFRGLPELTNSNGTPCVASCDTQAWSLATILDALYDVHNLVQKSK